MFRKDYPMSMPANRHYLLTVFTTCFFLMLTSFSFGEDTWTISFEKSKELMQLQTSQIAVEFAPEGSGMGILSLKDTGRDTEFIKRPASAEQAKVWKITMTDDRSKPDEFITIFNTDPCVEQTAELADGVLTLSWKGLAVGEQQDVIHVTMKVKQYADTWMTDWRMDIDNRSETYGIWHIFGPILELCVIGESPENDFLIMSPAEGRSVRDPINWDKNQNNERVMYDLTTDMEPVKINNDKPATGFGFGSQEPFGLPYPTARGQMQLNAYYQKDGNFYHASKTKGSGLYLSTYDSYGYPKVFYATGQPEDECLNFTYGMFPDDSAKPGLGFKQPFAHVIGVFEGDWYDAALIYREWATRQRWCARGTLDKRRDVPQWLKDCTAWIRLDSKGAPLSKLVDTVDFYRQELAGPLAVQWYKWDIGMETSKGPGICSQHPTLGIGREGFYEVVKDFNDNDIHVFPYINPRVWGYGDWPQKDLPATLDFEMARPYVSVKASGEVHHWGKGYDGYLAKMCVHTKWWQNFMTDTAVQIVKNYNVAGIYLDQSGECSYGGGYYDQQACHSPEHGHPLGITKALVDAELSRTKDILNACQIYRPDFMTNGEGAAELWIDQMNNKLIHYEIWPGNVPMYGVVYHDYQTYFGRSAQLEARNPEDPKPQMQIGWQLVLGNQIGRLRSYIVDTEIENRNLEYLKKACEVKNQFSRYLNIGRMLRPPYVSETPLVTTAEFKRINFICSLPSVVGSTWRSPDGNIAVVLTNMSLEKVGFTFGLDFSELGLDSNNSSLVQVYPLKKELKLKNTDPMNLYNFSLEPFEIAVFEIHSLSTLAEITKDEDLEGTLWSKVEIAKLEKSLGLSF
jgi:hypothetical protein